LASRADCLRVLPSVRRFLDFDIRFLVGFMFDDPPCSFVESPEFDANVAKTYLTKRFINRVCLFGFK